jgi:DNA-binding CsgD family transcriptional regulator
MARQSLSLLADRSWGDLLALPLGTLIAAETVLGVDELPRHALPESAVATVFGLRYLCARGTHHLSTGRLLAATADFDECARRTTALGVDLPSLAPWRTGLAAAHQRGGQHRTAAALAEQQMALPAATSRYTRALSLRVLAATRGPALLNQAAAEFRAAGDRLTAALCLAELSRTRSEAGDPTTARRLARAAADEAKSLSAADLLDRALRTHPAGATPHAPLPADLSDAERKVATLAAMGHSNREIADALHVMVSTVEQHLTRAYRKLGIRRRADLPAHLADS